MRSARLLAATATAAATLALGCTPAAPASVSDQGQRYTETVALPTPESSTPVPLAQVLTERRSTRRFGATELDLATLGQLLWAGQGITDDSGHRTAPSAGATYPIELYALTASEFIHYLPVGHRIEQRPDSRTLDLLADAAFEQQFVSEAPAVLVITGVESRTAARYGALAGDLMNREAGHVAQNILLQATALRLAAVPVGGFDPTEVAHLLALRPGEEVLYLLPVGEPSSTLS